MQASGFPAHGTAFSLQERSTNAPPDRGFADLADELARRIKALKATAWLEKTPGPEADMANDPVGSHPRTLAGRYRLEQLFAEGGFAHVWKAFDQELQLHRQLATRLQPCLGAQDVRHELPFVVGVMGDFSGDPTAPLKITESPGVVVTPDFLPADVRHVLNRRRCHHRRCRSTACHRGRATRA